MKTAKRVQGTPQHVENIRYMAAIEHHDSATLKSPLPVCSYRDIYGICRLMIGGTKSKFCNKLCKYYKCPIIYPNLNYPRDSCVYFNNKKHRCKIAKQGCDRMRNFTGVCRKYCPHISK